jgi:iron complex transport system ATP-binding protein
LHNQQGITLVATLHDLNLAALYFPRLVVMHRGRLAADGTPEEVLRREQLEPVFGQSLVYARHPAIDVPLVAPVPGAVQQARTRSRPAV